MLNRLFVVLLAALVSSPAWAAGPDFLLAPGTNGSVISTPLVWMTTELNGLASGACATSSAGGTSGAFNQSNTSPGTSGNPGAPTVLPYLTSGGAFTPIVGQALYGWYLHSYDGGTHFETLVATCSTTVPPLARPADFVIPLVNAAYASGNLVWGPVALLPWDTYKVVVWNIGTTALPSTGNTITAFPTALQY